MRCQEPYSASGTFCEFSVNLIKKSLTICLWTWRKVRNYRTAYFRHTDAEEIMCIRWHMGAFDERENWKYYSAAVKKYPNVLYTHVADMTASQIIGV